jgi:glyoxylase-like metal-dependent hydrolase (beta-lactamase superfamily II)
MRSLLLLFACMIAAVGMAQPRAYRPVLVQLDSGVYVHKSFDRLGSGWFPSNGLVVLTADSAVLIDSGWGNKATKEIVRLVERQLHRHVAACISTHFHADRTGGVPWLKQHGVRTYATARTRELAQARGEGVPALALGTDTAITIDGTTLRFWHPGGGHTPDNSVVWLPRQRVLFGGCLVKSTEANNLGNLADADMAAYPATIRAVQHHFPEARIVVPGHQAWGGLELLAHTLMLLEQR